MSKSVNSSYWIYFIFACVPACSVISDSLQSHRLRGMFQIRILEWVAKPSSRGSSRPRDQIHILRSSVLTGRLFTTSTTWEALLQFV